MFGHAAEAKPTRWSRASTGFLISDIANENYWKKYQG
jgi:hypothetical protein